MAWAKASGHPATRRWLAYPVAMLLASALSAGCAGERQTAGPPVQGPKTSAAPPPTAADPTVPPTPPPAPDPTRPAAPGASLRYAFPVPGSASYRPTHSVYPATDIFAACGAPVVAVTDGTILEVSRVDRFDRSGPIGPLNGGKFVSLLGDDGVRYYGSHLTDVAAGIDAGMRVRAGQRIGAVGKTGNANNVCHLHFGISPPCQKTGDWWIRRGVVWPATFLDAWRKKIGKTPVDKVTAWHRERGCPKAP